MSEQEYAQRALPPLRLIAEALTVIGDDIGRSQDGDPDVTIRLTAASVAFIIGHDQLATLSPPLHLADYHDRLLEATAQCKIVGEQLPIALDSNDLVHWAMLVDPMTRCGEGLDEASRMLN
ncbi:MAG: hypothetical protein HC911_18160 [Chloroflexaceae bacterium]|nr:hypothetical protein [Chloroflexaceae bacterium]